MAIDTSADDLTINKNGFAFRKASQIVQSEINQILTHTDQINDFTVGSISRTLIEAEAIELEKLYYYTLENLHKAIDDSVTSAFGFTRKQATSAYGNVTIILNGPLQQDLVINRGVSFYSDNPNFQQIYRTQTAYRIPKGTQTFYIPVYCTVKGSYGNIPANVINRTTDISSISQITNLEAFNTGFDEETPQQAKIRFRQMIQSLARGTNQSLVYATESVPNVAGATLFESTYGAVVIYAHDANGNLSDDLRDEIAQKLIPYRPAGIKVFILPVHKSLVTAEIKVSVNDTTLETPNFLQLVRQDISDYINSLTVGDPLYKANIIQKVMDISDNGVIDVSVDLKVYPDSGLKENSTIDDDSIINVKGVMVNQPYLRPADITNDKHYGQIGVTNTKIKEQAGKTFNDATPVEIKGQPTEDAVTIDDIYHTNSNEILRLALCNVQFKTLAESDIETLSNNETLQTKPEDTKTDNFFLS